MAIQTLPGTTGFLAQRVNSNMARSLGKFTDSNHLESFHNTEPSDYDKKIISLYTQSSLYANDFMNMINKSTPYYIENGGSSWKWQVEVPFQYAKIVEIPTATAVMTKPGIDNQEFTIIIDTGEFSANRTISLGSKQYGPRLYVTKDPMPYNSAFLYTVTLLSENPYVDFVSPRFLSVGTEVEGIGSEIGEFDQSLPGLGRMANKIDMFQSMGSGSGREHTITEWADSQTLKDNNGKPLDLMVYINQNRNSQAITRNDLKWEPFIEYQLRKDMMDEKVSKMIWNRPGSAKTAGSQQNVKRVSAGVYHTMQTSGNYVPYNKGEFSGNLLRRVFGDLFYRRVDVANRRVKLYTNEAGFDTAQQAFKQDAMNSGLSFVADSGDRFLEGKGQSITYNFAFSSMVSRETGKVELVHLKELDLPGTNMDFGQNKKSTPIYMVFDVSPDSDGSMKDNIREVRIKGEPSMTWGYIHGTRHHLGFAASQGMSSANMLPGYKIWMKDRYDVFIEDMSRVVLIEEIPQF